MGLLQQLHEMKEVAGAGGVGGLVLDFLGEMCANDRSLLGALLDIVDASVMEAAHGTAGVSEMDGRNEVREGSIRLSMSCCSVYRIGGFIYPFRARVPCFRRRRRFFVVVVVVVFVDGFFKI